MTGKVVINRCPQGTLLSAEGLIEYVRRKYGGIAPAGFGFDNISRTDPVLVTMMEENAAVFGGHCSRINILAEPSFPYKIARKGNFEWLAAVPEASHG